MINVVILGDPKSGKTSLFHRLTKDQFYESYCQTISQSFGVYERYVFYDTCAVERFEYTTLPYLKIADAAIIVYVGEKNEQASKQTDKWEQRLRSVNRRNIPILTVANKADLGGPGISCKEDDVRSKLRPFLETLRPNPKIAMTWIQYLGLLFPTIESVTGQIPDCSVS